MDRYRSTRVIHVSSARQSKRRQNFRSARQMTATDDQSIHSINHSLTTENRRKLQATSVELHSVRTIQSKISNRSILIDLGTTVSDIKSPSKNFKKKRKKLIGWRKIFCSLLCIIALILLVAAAVAAIVLATNRKTSVPTKTTSTIIYTTTMSTTSTTSTTTTAISFCWNSTGMTVAGITSSPGSTAHQLKQPFDVRLDSSNALYIADRYNHRIQKWLVGASNGSTVAGQSSAISGTGLSYLDSPANIQVAPNNDIYVAEIFNHRVVKWSNGASIGTLVAGTGISGSANNQLHRPHGIAGDWSSGIIYIADHFNHRIMQYFLSNTSSGNIIAGGNGPGTGSNQLNLPFGIYFDSLSNSLFIVNYASHTIVRWTIGASSWTLVAGSSGISGSTSTLLNNPSDVAIDRMGNMYVADTGNHHIQFFLAGQSNGTTIAGVTLSVGSSSNLLYLPFSLAVDTQLNVYVADFGNYRIQKFFHYSC